MKSQLLFKMSEISLDLRVALDKATAAANAVQEDYFSTDKPNVSLLEGRYDFNSNLCAISTDYLFEASKLLEKLESIIEGTGETA